MRLFRKTMHLLNITMVAISKFAQKVGLCGFTNDRFNFQELALNCANVTLYLKAVMGPLKHRYNIC
jgi:hypothetical protein